MSDSLWPHGLQHARLPCPSPTPGACSNSCPLSGDDIQPSHPLSSPLLLRSIFRSIRAFPLSQFFASGGQSIESFTYSQNLWVVGWSRLGVIYYIKKKYSGSQCLSALWRSFLGEWTDLELMQTPRGGFPSWKPHSICSVWREVMYNI